MSVITMQAEIIREWSRLPALAAEWNTLLRQSGADTVFLTWEWVKSWADVVGQNHTPLVIVVRDPAGSLCGLAPLYLTRYWLVRAWPYRILRIMADRATGAEYPDFIVRKDCEREAMRCIVDCLKAIRRQWDCLWLPNVSGWTGARQRAGAASELGGFYSHSRTARFAHIELPASIEAYERSLSDNRRKQFRAQRSKILGKGRATVTRCASLAELPSYLQALFDLHNARRKLLGEEGTFSRQPDETRFYQEFAPKALAAGWLWLFALRDRGVIKAVQLGYVYNNVFNQMQEGFDPEYTAGAGNVLRLEVIRECIARGVRDYDFLGGYTEHKRRWMAQLRHGEDFFIGRASLANRVIFLGKVWPTGRYLRPVPAC